MPVTTTPRGALAPACSQNLFDFLVENLFDHFPHPFPNRFLQALPAHNGLVSHPFGVTFPHGVFLLFLTARQGSSGFCLNGSQENTPFLFLQESGRNLTDVGAQYT